MSRKPASIAPEAIATIDRAIVTLNALKAHLKAKNLKGTALYKLLLVAQDELKTLEQPFYDLNNIEIDELVANIRRHRAALDEEP